MTADRLFLATLVLYVLSAGLFHVPLLLRGTRGLRMAQAAAALGFLAHSAAIFLRARALDHAPYVELREAVSTVAWTIVLLTLLVHWRRRTGALGAPAMALAALLMLLADTLPAFSQGQPLVPAIYENPVDAHIGAIVAAVGSFAVAFSAALLYLSQERQLKSKHLGEKPPGALSLAEIEQVANSFAAFGFSMLSLGLVLGVVYAASGLWKNSWFLDPIVVSTIATWCVYAWYLYSRGVRGARGRVHMYYLVAGFTLAFCTLLFVRALFPGQHGFRTGINSARSHHPPASSVEIGEVPAPQPSGGSQNGE